MTGAVSLPAKEIHDAHENPFGSSVCGIGCGHGPRHAAGVAAFHARFRRRPWERPAAIAFPDEMYEHPYQVQASVNRLRNRPATQP
jgi:hypothetical protein